MKFADEMALVFLVQSILLTDWMCAFSQCTGLKSLTKRALVLLFSLVCQILHWPCLPLATRRAHI